MNQNYELIKIDLTEAEFKTLKDISSYALERKKAHLKALYLNEYNIDKEKIHVVASEIIRFEMFIEMLKGVKI